MKHWELRTINPNDGRELRRIFVEAPSEPHARQWALDRKMLVDGVRSVSLEEIPKGTTIERYERRQIDPLTIIAESPLIRSPVFTIALGTMLGMLLSGLIVMLLFGR
jgi:hypothetical protein